MKFIFFCLCMLARANEWKETQQWKKIIKWKKVWQRESNCIRAVYTR